MPNIAALVTVAAVMFAVLGGITLIAHIYNLNNIKSKTVGDGQHGTARWATKAEIRKTCRHIPFTPKKWRRQAKDGQEPTVTQFVHKKHSLKMLPTEEALPQGIVVGCKGGKHSTTALVDTGDIHVLMIGAAVVCAAKVLAGHLRYRIYDVYLFDQIDQGSDADSERKEICLLFWLDRENCA